MDIIVEIIENIVYIKILNLWGEENVKKSNKTTKGTKKLKVFL